MAVPTRSNVCHPPGARGDLVLTYFLDFDPLLCPGGQDLREEQPLQWKCAVSALNMSQQVAMDTDNDILHSSMSSSIGHGVAMATRPAGKTAGHNLPLSPAAEDNSLRESVVGEGEKRVVAVLERGEEAEQWSLFPGG